MNAADTTSSAPLKRGRGKPTKYTPELAAAIVADIRRSGAVTKAFVGNSIGQTTGYVWTYRRPEFASAVQAARGHYRKMQAIRSGLIADREQRTNTAAQLYANRLRS